MMHHTDTPQQDGRPLQGDAPRRLAEKIAAYVVLFDLAAAPHEVVERARVGIIDSIGVMLAGSQEHVADIACTMIAAEGSAPQSTVFGRKLRASPQAAAFANGVAAHAMDYDFTYARGQSVSAVLPALLALAEASGAAPADLLAAFVVACEVAARLIRAAPRISTEGGWHTTGMVGSIAAGIGAARLLGLAASHIPDVVGIAASMAGGFCENYGTMTKPLHAGNAARSGITAALLGAQGFSASPVALEGPAGYFATFSRGLPTNLAAFDDLGRVHNLVTPGYKLKRYASGGLGHSSIDAALALRGELAGQVSDVVAEIARIEVGVTHHAFERIGSHYPSSVESAKFSVPYLGAWTVLYGAPSLATFTETALADPRVKALASKVSHHVDPEFGDEPLEAPGRVKVTLTNGRTFEKLVRYASGSPNNPLSAAEIEAKFIDCAIQAMSEDRAKKLFAWLADLPRQTTFEEFWPLMRSA